MQRWRIVSVCSTLFLVAAPAGAEVSASAGAQVSASTGKHPPPCQGNEKQDCIPADVAIYAPFDLRVGRWDLEGTTRDYSPTQFTVGLNPDLTLHARGATSRSRIFANMGGGNSGFEWNFGGIWTFGGRLSLGQGKQGGLFGRIGIDGYLGGNSDFYHSHLAAPRLELGYQLFKTDSLFVEAAGHGALMLVGRHRVFDRTRDIGFSMSAGGFVTVQMRFLRVQLDAMRIFEGAHQPKTPIDRGSADLCGILSGLGLCITASSERGEVWSADQGVDTHADFIGFKVSGVDADIIGYAL